MKAMEGGAIERILAFKAGEVEAARRRVPEERLREEAEGRGKTRPFRGRLERPGPAGINIVAEIKRASPSRGVLRANLNPEALAAEYEAGGAAALSVLTEIRFFLGSPADLEAARKAAALPVLRKDFLFCPYQIYESAAMGADALLLIARILTEGGLADLLALSGRLGLDALVEVHSEADVAKARAAGATLIGINNRDLGTFTTDPLHTLRLLPLLPPGAVVVSASGIRSRGDVLRGLESGVYNFLVGESLVTATSPGEALRSLQGLEGKP